MIARFGAVVLVSVLSLSLTGCGNDESPRASPASTSTGDLEELTVVARDITFPEKSYLAEPGTVAVAYRNEGSIKHTLVVEGIDGFKLDVKSKGDVDTGTIELEAGEYTIYCDVPGHRQAGMEAALEVT